MFVPVLVIPDALNRERECASADQRASRAPRILIADTLLTGWNSSMSKKSRVKAASFASPPSEPKTFFARWGSLLASGIIVLAALAAYHNSFSGAFILDDQHAITDNPTLRHFGSALSPSPNAPTGGRPLLNLT